jgi:hypothetical protein
MGADGWASYGELIDAVRELVEEHFISKEIS